MRSAIPPESPHFIEIPRQIQPYAIRRPWVKGVLPVPRQIISQKPQDQAKSTVDYLASVTPEPLRDNSADADARTRDFVSWKARQAERRRQNLREGLVELHHRDARSIQQMTERSSRKQAKNKAARNAFEREDDRLTRSTVLDGLRAANIRGLPDPGREARLVRKRENVARMQALQEERRREKLHTLYVNAGHFITTRAQLDETIDKVFDDTKQFESDMRPGSNVWNLGVPETVQELLGDRSGRGAKAVDPADENAVITRKRMDQIAAELTGGKMQDTR